MESLSGRTPERKPSPPSGTYGETRSANGEMRDRLYRNGISSRTTALLGPSNRSGDDSRDDSKQPLGFTEPPFNRRLSLADHPPVSTRYIDVPFRPNDFHTSNNPHQNNGTSDSQLPSRTSRVQHSCHLEKSIRNDHSYQFEYMVPPEKRLIYDLGIGVSRPPHLFTHRTHTNWYPQTSNRPTSQIGNDIHIPTQSFKSQVIIPRNLAIPDSLSRGSTTKSAPQEEKNASKRQHDSPDTLTTSSSSSSASKRGKTEKSDPFGKLDMLCRATLALGPMDSEDPSGCSCPKSQCIALYCECFKSGRRCTAGVCSCKNCKNTLEESGPEGARSIAIHSILQRNPRAFTSGGQGTQGKSDVEGQGCNCIRSRCLKLYCQCFQQGKTCDPDLCTCVDCVNLDGDSTGLRELAIQQTLEKRPDAFKKKPREKEPGSGCACKNNQCLRRYCECFRTNLKCTKKCSCKSCKNGKFAEES